MEWVKSNKPEPQRKKNKEVIEAEKDINAFMDSTNDCVAHECGDQYIANKVAVRYRQAVINLKLGKSMYVSQRQNRVYLVKGQR